MWRSPQAYVSRSGQRSETERGGNAVEVVGGDFPQTYEGEGRIECHAHARERRLTSSENLRQEANDYRQRRAHPAAPPVDPAHSRSILDVRVHIGGCGLIVRNLLEPTLLEAVDQPFDLGKARRNARRSEIGQEAERALALGAMPARHAQARWLDAIVEAELAKTAVALGVQRARLKTGVQPSFPPNVFLAGELRFEAKLHTSTRPACLRSWRASTLSLRAPCPRAYARSGEARGKESGAAVPLWIVDGDNEPAEQNEKSGAVNQRTPREATLGLPLPSEKGSSKVMFR